MEELAKFLNKNQLLREMLIIKEAMNDALRIKKSNPKTNFCIWNSRKNLNILATEYKSRFN